MSEGKERMDEVEGKLQREEQGELGDALRSAAERIEPRPEFARQLESRLLSTARVHDSQPQVGIEKAVVTETPIIARSLRPIQPPAKKRTRLGRFGSFAVGVFGAAAIVVLLIGMALLMQLQRDAD